MEFNYIEIHSDQLRKIMATYLAGQLLVAKNPRITEEEAASSSVRIVKLIEEEFKK